MFPNIESGDHDLTCPECGFEYMHVESICVGSKEEQPKAIQTDKGGYNKVKISNCERSEISIFFYCEGGHRWVVGFDFDKGRIAGRGPYALQPYDFSPPWENSDDGS